MKLTIDSLTNILFSKEDVFKTKEDVITRKCNLSKALTLGNLYKRKVVIKFRTLEGYMKRVEASVWSLGEEYISIKGGFNIPIRSIEEVEF